MSSDTCSGTPLSWFCHCSVAYWTRSIGAAIRSVLCGRANPTMSSALARHWPEYAMEAAELGLFMAAAGLFGVLLYHPASPTAHAVADPFVRRVFMALAMGLTAIALIYSPWGQRSGAHFNPAVTLTFFRLGKVAGWDAVFYAMAQIGGGLSGILVVAALTGGRLSHPAVSYVVTVPGAWGVAVAFGAEVLISFGLMSVVLTVSNTARSFASALPANLWTAFWIYLPAPPLGMQLASDLHVRLARVPVLCAKLDHAGRRPCIFRRGDRS